MKPSSWVAASVLAVGLGTLTAPAGAADKLESLNGYAEFRKGTALVVEGQLLVASPGTKIKGKDLAARFETIPLGYEVRAKGMRQEDGSLLAIELEAKPNGGSMFEGEVLRAHTEVEQASLRLGYLPQEVGVGKVRLRSTGKDVERVRGIVARLVPPYKSGTDFRAYVVTHDEWNAFAMANGMIVVHSSMLEDFDDDELASVLGHEIAHVTYEHSRRRAKKNMWAQLGVAVLQGAAQGIKDERVRDVAQGVAQLGASTFTNTHSRANEDQSDRVGMRYAFEAGFDVTKTPGVWRKFAQRYGAGGKLQNFIYGSHSLSLERAVHTERQVALNYRDAVPSSSVRTAGETRRKPAARPAPRPAPTPEPAEEPSEDEEEEIEAEWADEEEIGKALMGDDGLVLTDADLVPKSIDSPVVAAGMTIQEVKAIQGEPIVAFEDVMVYSHNTILVAAGRVKEIKKVEGK